MSKLREFYKDYEHRVEGARSWRAWDMGPGLGEDTQAHKAACRLHENSLVRRAAWAYHRLVVCGSMNAVAALQRRVGDGMGAK